MEKFYRELEAIKSRIGYRSGAVSVREFFDNDIYVGIASYPSDYQEFIDFPNWFSDEEKQAYEAYIKQWNKRGDFAFCWAEEYWMNKEGKTVSS
jgi:hypothetical protein